MVPNPKFISVSSSVSASPSIKSANKSVSNLQPSILKNSFRALLFLGILFSLSACGASKKLGKADLKNPTSEALLKVMAARKMEVDWLEAKARMDFSDERQSVKFNATIRMQKDKLVWIAIKKLGLEVGRVLIRPDSAFVIDRLNGEYYAEPLTWVERTYNIPADFKTIQELLLGNPVFFQTAGYQLASETDYFQLSGQGGGLSSRMKIQKADLTLREMYFEDAPNQRHIRCALDSYEVLAGDRKFSYLRQLELKSPATGRMAVGIQFSDVEINVPKEIKFEIPNKYTRQTGK